MFIELELEDGKVLVNSDRIVWLKPYPDPDELDEPTCVLKLSATPATVIVWESYTRVRRRLTLAQQVII